MSKQQGKKEKEEVGVVESLNDTETAIALWRNPLTLVYNLVKVKFDPETKTPTSITMTEVGKDRYEAGYKFKIEASDLGFV